MLKRLIPHRRSIAVFLIMAITLLEPKLSQCGDWPQFRGPDGSGLAKSSGLPTTWSIDRNVLWKTPVPGPGASSPVVFGDRIYLTCYTGYDGPGSAGSVEDLRRHLMAFRMEDGLMLWDKTFAPVLPEELKIRDHGYAANTPLVDKERIYVFLGKSGVLALDHQGAVQWKVDVGMGASDWGTAASPVMHRNILYINASVESGSLIALDKSTGREIWRAGGIRESWNTPILTTSPEGREELVLAMIGSIHGYHPQTGELLWTCDTDISWYMVPTGAARDGVVYYLGGRSGTTMLAVKTGGQGNVTASHRLWTQRKGSNVSSPVLHGDHLYWVQDQRGIAYTCNLTTGEVLYEERLDRADQFYSSPILAGNAIYYLDRMGRTFIVKASPQFELLAVNDLRDGSQFNGSPAVSHNSLILRSDKFLYRIGTSSEIRNTP